MTEAIRKLMIRDSEIRERINRLQGIEGRTDEQTADLAAARTEYATVQTELRAALSDDDQGGDQGDGEARERREIRGRAAVHRYVAAALGGAALSGAEAECSAAHGCPGLVPLELFAGDQGETRETRAHTPGPAADTVTNTAATVHPVFDRSVAAYLGVDMPSVAAGQANYPYLNTSVTAGPKAAGTAADETAGAFGVRTATPKRITGSFRIRREDMALLPSLESDLRSNLSSVMTDAYDAQLLNGNNTDPNLNGLFQQLTDPTDPAAGAETFARYVAAFAGHVDGKYSTELTGVRALVGVATYRHMASTFATSEDATSALSYLRGETGGVRASGRVAAAASNVQQAVVRRTNPAGDRVAVSPVWQGMELIRDPYTDAKKAEVILTALMLVGSPVILRPDAFVQDSFRLAA